MDYNIAPTRFYRSRDNLKNLKIRINLRREVLQELSEPVVRTKQNQDTPESNNLVKDLPQGTQKTNLWTETFSWYQKIDFDSENADHSRQVIFFTQLDQENFVDYEDINRTVATSIAQLPVAAYEILNHTNKNQPSQTQFQENKPDGRYLEHNFQTMYIRAAFLMKPDFSYWREYTLCSIRVYSDGGLEMRPGFNTKSNPIWKLQTIDGSKFYYTIENISELRSFIFEEESNENRQTPTTFILPDKGKQKMYVFAELVSASKFTRNNIYVQYFLDVPEGWNCSESIKTKTSQISAYNNNDEYSEAQFCFPIELEIETTKLEVTEWPHLLFQVNSYDIWDRRIVEGYAFTVLPQVSGVYDLTLNTWVPKGSVRDNMSSFFIGGSPELADIKFLLSPQREGTHASILNKYGFTTQSGGTLRLRINSVLLSGKELKKGNFG